MHSRHAIALMLLIIPLIQLAAASTTVTLSGTCPVSVINQSSNYMLFNLSNSGNGVATNLVLVPQFEGATTSNSTFTIPLVAPGSNYSARFYLYNFTEPGSYAEYIWASYSQGSSTFVTVFPCLADIMENAQSLLRITSMNRTGSRLSVDVVNLAQYPIETNVVVQAPPTFGVTPKEVPLRVSSNGQSAAVFNLSVPNYTSAQFPVVAAVSYSNSGVHYATFGFYVVNFAASAATSSGMPSTVTIGAVAAITILIILIAVSFVRERKPKQPVPSAETPKPVGAQVVQ